MPTIGELFDEAFVHLRRAAEAPLEDPSEAGTAVAVRDVERLLVRLREGFLESAGRGRGSPLGHVSQAERLLTENLDAALRNVATAVRLLPEPDRVDIPVPLRSHLADAERLVASVRDVIASHRGPDAAPLTPYTHLLTTLPARDYVVYRVASLAGQVGKVAGVLATPWDPLVNDALLHVRSFLDRAAVLGGDAARTADPAIASFPLALPVEPVRGDGQAPVVLIGDDCERLSRAAFDMLHGRTDRPMSGSDLHEKAHWTAISRLLAGRMLLHVAGDGADGAGPQLAALAREAADALRGSSRAWHEVAQGWRRVVDTADPRAHPMLPLPSYELVRLGKVVRLPQITPHPATVIAQTSVVRLGRLLYGETWLPTGARPDSAQGRDVILAASRGEGPLLNSLYRLSATGWQLAVASPAAIQRARAGLVTDEIELRPSHLKATQGFYPAHPRQLEHLATSYAAAARAEETVSSVLLRVARAAGVPIPRARLDARAHQNISSAVAGWGATAEGLPQTPRVSGAAARARSTTAPAARPGMPIRPVLQRSPLRTQPDSIRRTPRTR